MNKVYAQALLQHVYQYTDHLRGCSIWLPDSNPASDYCNCGYSDAKGSAEKLKQLIAEAA